MSFCKTLEKEKRARESARARMPCVSLYCADGGGGGGGFTMGNALMLLTATNSVKRHLIQPLHTSSQDAPAVRASNLRLCTFFLSGSPP